MTNPAALHTEAMNLVDRALTDRLHGNVEEALRCTHAAFQKEREAALLARASNLGEPSTSILFRSAASLALEANEPREAERLIAQALAAEPPPFVADELRDLLEQVYFRRHLAVRGLVLQPAEFQLSLAGHAVGFGIVPSNEFVRRVNDTELILYRTAERKLNQPFRERGRRRSAIQKEINVYVSTPRAASFAVTFRVGSSDQLVLPAMGFAEDLIAEVLTCFEIVEKGDVQELRSRIKDEAYYRNFVSIASRIAPDGDDVTTVGFTASGSGSVREVAVRRPREALQPFEAVAVDRDSSRRPIEVTGRLLFASKLEHKNEIRIQTRNQTLPVRVPEGMMNDIVKPLWDEVVLVRGVSDGGLLILETIEAIELAEDPSE